MAADVGDKKDGVNGINITPLVDVCLVLVLIFMVTMPFSLIRGIDVKREALKKYGLSTPQENVSARLTPKELLVKNAGGEEVPVSATDETEVLMDLLKASTGKRFFLKVDPQVSHGRTVNVMNTARGGGAKDISLVE